MRFVSKVLAILVCVAMMLSIVGCSGNQGSGSSTGSAAGDSAGGSSAATATPAGSSSGEKITITIMDYSDSCKEFRDAANEKYSEENPNIKVEYTMTTRAQLTNTILSAISSGQAPDLFPLPDGVTSSKAISEGWYLPLNDYTDKSVWDRFIEGTIVEGKCMVDGKIYMIPESSGEPHCMILYNKDIFKEAGLDPEVAPKTYSEFREYAAKITKAGGGRYYGIIDGGKQYDRMNVILAEWSSLIGAPYRRGYSLNLRTGTPDWNNEAVYKVFELWKNLYEDGSIHPNTASYIAPDARAAFAGGQAGMIVQGWWNIGVWSKNNPNLNYGVFAPPAPDGETYSGSIGRTTGIPWMGVYSKTKHPKEAVDYFLNVVNGNEYQSATVAAGVSCSALKGVNEQAGVNSATKEYFSLNAKLSKMIPEFELTNPQTSAAISKFKEVHPNPVEIFQGVISGQVKDYKTALAQYSKDAGAAWGEALKEANSEGNNLSTKDFSFPDWDMTRDFTAEDYAALK